MFSSKIGRMALGFTVDNGIDITLTIQRNVLGTVIGYVGKTNTFQYRLDDVRGRGGELNELETHEAHGVFK